MNTKNKTLRRIAAVLGLAAILCASPVPVSAQSPLSSVAARLLAGEYVTGGYQAVSTETALLIWYTGTNANGGTITVAAGGDLTFSQGPVGSSTVDATMECDSSIAASGSRNGIYDLSTPDTACDTMGEIVDLINSQGSNWRAVIIDGLRSDATDNVLITRSEVAANTVAGVSLLTDGTTLFKQTFAVIPANARKPAFYVNGTSQLRMAATFKPDNPFKGQTPILFQQTSVSTYGSGTSFQQILCVAVTYSAASTGGTEVVTTAQRAAGATTVESTWTQNTNFGTGCPTGQKMLVRTNNSAAMSAGQISAAGVIY